MPVLPLNSESAAKPVQSATSASPPNVPKLSEVMLAMLGVTSAPAPTHALPLVDHSDQKDAREA